MTTLLAVIVTVTAPTILLIIMEIVPDYGSNDSSSSNTGRGIVGSIPPSPSLPESRLPGLVRLHPFLEDFIVLSSALIRQYRYDEVVVTEPD